MHIEPIMEVCNLCLQDSYPLVNTDLSKRLSACIKFSHLPKVLLRHSYVCELCLQNFTTFINFHDMVVNTESKIRFLRNELSCRKINLKSICDGADVLEKCQHCRVCLKPVKWLGIYLYKNDTNILDFSLLQKMFSYCNLNLDYEATEHPILCRECFEMLQIIFNFKKTITEAFDTTNNSSKSNDTCEQAIDGDLYAMNRPELRLRVRKDLMCQQIDEPSNSPKASITGSDPKLQCNCFVEIERLPDILLNPVYLKTKKGKSLRLYSLRKLTSRKPEQKEEFSKDKVQERCEPHLENDALANRISQQTHKGKRIRSYLGRICKPKKRDPSHGTIKNEMQEGSLLPLLDTQGNPKKHIVNRQTARKKTRVERSLQERQSSAASKPVRKWNLGYHYTNDDLLLLKLYYKHTNFATEFPSGYWDIIRNEWNKITHKNVNSRELSKKLYWQLSEKVIPQDLIDTIKSEVKTCLEVQQNQHIPPVDLHPLDHGYPANDSTHSFSDAVEYSDVPIKVEPPCDMDIEIWFPEPKIEPQSESEMDDVASPPQLDRMDTPPPLSLKKEALRSCIVEHNYSLLQKHIKKPKISVNSSRSVKKLEEEFRCTECFFTTQVKWAANRHILLHQQGRLRIYECPSCTYRITSKLSLNIHMKTHSKDKDLPMLTPWYHEGKQTLEEKREQLSMSTQT